MGARQQRTLPIQRCGALQFERQAHHSRYERPAVREQLAASRPRRRVRPDRRLGALSASARPPLLYVCASDAHGTPTMLRAEQEGIAPEALIKRVERRAPRDFATYRISVDNYLTTHAPENEELTAELYRRLEAGGSSTAKRSSKPTTSSDRCSCRTATSAEPARSATRPISTATPAKAAARRIRRSSSRMPFRRSPARSRQCASPSTCSSG